MDAHQHAHLAHQLITACEGVDAIVRAKLCRVSSTQLYAYTDAGSGQFMPADVIADLEGWCGEPTYSRAIADGRPASARVVELITAACQETEAAAEVQRDCRVAAESPHGASPRQRRRIEQALTRLDEGAREVRDALAQSMPGARL